MSEIDDAICGFDFEGEDDDSPEDDKCHCPYCYCSAPVDFGMVCGDCLSHAHQG